MVRAEHQTMTRHASTPRSTKGTANGIAGSGEPAIPALA